MIPNFWRKKYLRRLIIDFFRATNDLQKKIFLIYLNRDYIQQHLLYEKELHQQREIIFVILQKIRKTMSKLGYSYANHLESVFELVISLDNLRYRVKDHTTFEVCEKELKTISQDLSELFKKLINIFLDKTNSALDLSQLKQDIESFEEINRTTLQMVVNDPIIFLIFIRNLYAIGDELADLVMDSKNNE